MELALPGIPLTFEVTFDSPALDAAISVFDVTNLAAPVLVTGPTAMHNTVANTYCGQFTGLNNKSYLILKAVYTDGTFATLDPSYSQGTETIVVESFGSGGGGGGGSNNLIGYVQSGLVLVGVIQC